MSLKIDKDNVYFLPPTNKNSLSTALPQFSGNIKSFEFKVKFKPDFSKSKQGINYGIMMLNGKHLGISWLESEDGQSNIVGSLWTEEEIQQIYSPLTYDRNTLKRTNDYTYAHFIVDIENGWMRLNNTATKKIKGKLSNDYRFSYLWLGCGNNFENCDDEYRWNFYGNINYSKCQKKTKYKVYDESENGNHLLKYSREWFE
jgi:hypothetical protein